MATEFYNVDGELVALRYWGGDERGTVIELRDGARFGELDTPLRGAGAGVTTLRELAAEVGRGRLSPAEVEQRRRVREGVRIRPERVETPEELWRPCRSCGTQTRYRSPHTGAPRCGQCLSG